ncbi:amidohydrolase family protein [Paenibacillus sp. MMS20-IR301]|uniref:amidohydrolase family protein n=1 Tax=Paenibacillus sp. MMS20-IR301 TaxID=2895946 RepID=UPI0028E75E3F|nr:amidohydrolase family protein [Paenibacillus sp. MMS20-IR301]WNS43102.1 amidohydrolase family protein [Paenibacillus sp. MMS20-IR301]
MRIDTHQHYWRIDRGDYGWITPEHSVLYRDFMPSDLEPLLNQHNFNGSIIVQAAPTIDETNYILALADQTSSVLGVVGWLDLFDPDHRKYYDQFRRSSKFKGFRIMIQDMPDASRILDPQFIDRLRGYAAEDVPVDLLLVSEQMETVLQLLQKVPNLRSVINHIAKPSIKSREFESWARYLSDFAQFPGIYCKLSGMVTEADHKQWRLEEFTLYIRKVLEEFGPDRVMFGSDWPVCLLAAEYGQVMEILLHALPETWGESERDRLFGMNAKVFYKL